MLNSREEPFHTYMPGWNPTSLLLLQEWKHALFVLPYISVVAEKTAHLTDILRSSGCSCKGFYGNAERGTPLQAK
jgi:hypothetical protein